MLAQNRHRQTAKQDAAVFVRGLAHIQPEPAWGGSADSAAVLRGTCALALVNCKLGDLETLGVLVTGLADPEKSVRMDTALAIAQLARAEGALLLRLKALLGDAEPEVLGQCFHALLSLGEPVSFFGRFLQSADDDVRLEAAGALAQSRDPEAMEMLKTFWGGLLSPELRSAFVFALGASPQPEAAEFLLSILAEASQDLAASTIKSLAASRFRDEVREKVRTAVNEKCDPNLHRTFAQEFS